MTDAIIEMPRTQFAMNRTNKLVIRSPKRYQAVIPTTYELNSPPFPLLQGVPNDQSALETYLTAIQQPPGILQRPLRDGYLYIFRDDTLYAEYKIKFDTDNKLSYYTAINLIQEQGKDRRQVDENQSPSPYILVPADTEYQLAYSEGQWPWVQLQLLGGLELKQCVPQFTIPAPTADSNLNNWTPSLAKKLRQQRCHTQTPTVTPKEGLLEPLNQQTRTPSPLLPDSFTTRMPALEPIKNHSDALEQDQTVNDWVLIPLKDPLLMGHQIATNIHQGWDLLNKVFKNMQDPNHPHFEYSKYYESALIAYQVFYQRNKVPKGSTRWQQDQGNEEAFKHLSLKDLEAALAIDLRRTLNQIISTWQNELANFLAGHNHWQQWDEQLNASLNDYIAMPDVPAALSVNDDDPELWGYGYRRWYHLDALISPITQAPHQLSQFIEADPISLELADKIDKQPAKQLIKAIIAGQHALSEHVFNAPQIAHIRPQRPLVDLVKFNHSLKHYDDTIYQKEKALLNALNNSSECKLLPYRNDLAIQHKKNSEQKNEEKIEQLSLSHEEKAGIALLRAVNSLTSTVGNAALSLNNKTLATNTLNPTVEKIRHLYNTIARVHLRYTSFEKLLAQSNHANPETKSKLISTFLNNFHHQKTQTFSKTTPNDYQAYRQEQLRVEQADAEQHYLKQRRDLKKQLRDELIPDELKQVNSQENQLRRLRAEWQDQQQQLITQKNQILRSYNDGSGDISTMQDAAASDSRYNALLNDIQQANEKLDQLTENQRAIKTRKAKLEAQLHWIETFFKQQQATRKQHSNDAAKALNDIDADAAPLQQFMSEDNDSPLQQLLTADQQHQQQLMTMSHNAAAEIATKNADYDKTLNDIKNNAKIAINEQSPEGKELLAFHNNQQRKMADFKEREIIISNDTNFDLLKEKYKNSNDKLLLDPDQSSLWQQQFEGNYLVLEGGEHLYASNPNYDAATHAMRDISVSSALMLFDFINLYYAIKTVSSSTENATSKRNILDLMGNSMGTLSSISNVWRLAHTHRQYANEATKHSSAYMKIMGTNAAKMGTKIGAAAAGIGIIVSVLDLAQNVKEGDDAAIADLLVLAGTIASFTHVVVSSALLGPIGITVGLIGILLKIFIFKEDNLLNTWLEQGPFSELKQGHRTRLIAPDRGYDHSTYIITHEKKPNHPALLNTPHLTTWQSSLVTYRCGIENSLQDKEGKPLPILKLQLPWQRLQGSLVLDQNYTVLALEYNDRHLSAEEPKLWLEPNDHTVYLKQDGTLYPIAVIGKPLAATAGAVCEYMDNTLNQYLNEKTTSDKSQRFLDDASDNDKFTAVMQQYPVASLELLLNALFPIKTELKLYPLGANGQPLKKHKLPGQSRTLKYLNSEIEAIRAVIEIEAPYFIEGQSAFQVKLTEAMSWFNWGNDMGRLKTIELSIDSTENSMNKKSKGEIINIWNLSHKKIDHTHKYEEGAYKIANMNKFIIIRDITKEDIINAKLSFNYLLDIKLQAWVRVSLSGNIEHSSHETIWFPWRTTEVFNGSSNDIDANTWSSGASHLT